MFEFSTQKKFTRREAFLALSTALGFPLGMGAFNHLNNNPDYDLQANLEQSQAEENVREIDREILRQSPHVLVVVPRAGANLQYYAVRGLEQAKMADSPYEAKPGSDELTFTTEVGPRRQPRLFEMDMRGSCWDIKAVGHELVNVRDDKAVARLVDATDRLSAREPLSKEKSARIVEQTRAIFHDPRNTAQFYQLPGPNAGSMRPERVVPSRTEIKGFACSGDRHADGREVVPPIPQRRGMMWQ
jgi:hypothetical protein